MSESPLFIITSEDKIIEKAADQLEKLLHRHYDRFKNALIGGLILLVIGGILLLVDSRSGRSVYTFLILPVFFFLSGIILIYVAFTRKVYVKEMDVALYPVIVVPYGNGSLSLVIDLLGKSGDDVSFYVPRIDSLSDELSNHLARLGSLSSSLYNLEEQQDSLIELQRVGNEGFLTTSFEVLVRSELSRLLERLRNRPYDHFSFKLFESGGEISAHPIKLIGQESLLVRDVSRLADDTVSKVSSLLKSLEVQYSDLLEDVRVGVKESRDVMSSYYDELNGLAEAIHKLMLRVMKKVQVRVCPRCYIVMRNDILLSSSYPVLMKSSGVDEEGNLEYECPRCGFIYLENVYSTEDSREPMKMYWFEVLQSRSWSRLYVSRLDEINRYLSEARRLKGEKYNEATRHLNVLAHQFRSYLLPMYIELNKLSNEIRANNTILGYVSLSLPATIRFCEKIEVGDEVMSAELSTKRFLNGEEILADSVEKLSKARKLKIDFTHLNEVAIEKLIEAHEKLGESSISSEIRRIIHEKDFEEFEKYLKEFSRGV